jgi:hypothetical protein
VAHKVLFGSDVESFEHELCNVAAEAVELKVWRRKGPIGKLHNLIRYISHSEARQTAFIKLQEAALKSREDDEGPKQRPLHLIKDDATRWNSWYDATERAIYLRQFIDKFTDDELTNYRSKLSRYEARSRSSNIPQKEPPKAPSLFADKLTPDDWDAIMTYMTILKPCKQATMKLQGNFNAGTNVKGAIWQVLPVIGELLKGFEEARQRHRPSESQDLRLRLLSPPPSQPSTQHSTRNRLFVCLIQSGYSR